MLVLGGADSVLYNDESIKPGFFLLPIDLAKFNCSKYRVLMRVLAFFLPVLYSLSLALCLSLFVPCLSVTFTPSLCLPLSFSPFSLQFVMVAL